VFLFQSERPSFAPIEHNRQLQFCIF
jgi:hypothetical protein